VIIFGERFVPELDMYREYRGTPRTEKITEGSLRPFYRILGDSHSIGYRDHLW
jgi:hypothetical protein